MYLPDADRRATAPRRRPTWSRRTRATRASTARSTRRRAIGSVALDPAAFPNAAALQAERATSAACTITHASGDTDGDGDFDALYTFGARSFSIWDATGAQVFDSGDALERITAAAQPGVLQRRQRRERLLRHRAATTRARSRRALALGTVDGRTYAFVGPRADRRRRGLRRHRPVAAASSSSTSTRGTSRATREPAPPATSAPRASCSSRGRTARTAAAPGHANEISGTTRLFEIVRP